ncbi:MAG: Glu-tRNA(Gln) amidotransferase subunit GatD [Candidatus Asgardarchaeia archaeon]
MDGHSNDNVGKVKRYIEEKGVEEGDFVRIFMRDGRVMEGFLIPHAELYSGEFIVLKMKNGYNVGISLDNIKDLKLISKGVPIRKSIKLELKVREDLPKLMIIGTGGTIASRVDYQSGAVYPAMSAEELYDAVPEIGNIANIETELLFNIFSEDMTTKHWTELSNEVYSHIKRGVDGVIITHGTDTMGYTAAALSFSLQNLPVPVVLVGSQRSSDRPSSDSSLNLKASVLVAARAPFAHVGIVMHGSMDDRYCLFHIGTKVRKCHTSRRDAFKSINDRPLAAIDVFEDRIMILKDNFLERDKSREPLLRAKFDDKVILIKTYPGIPVGMLDFVLEEDYHGLVLEGTGLGHTPTSMIDKLKALIREGVVVVMTSQCLWGRINMNVYRTGRELLKIGVIPGEDMLPETALVKLMWALGNFEDREEVKRVMVKNVAGEIKERSEASDYEVIEFWK